MIVFWISACVLATVLSAFIMMRAAQAHTAASEGADPLGELYRRQLAEIDEMAARGVLAEEERQSAFTEAARRLLGARRPSAPVNSRIRPALLPVVCGLTTILALALYLANAAPGARDHPFAARLAQWQGADPQSLQASEMAAVLASLAKASPNDPRLLFYLGRIRLAAGDPSGAAEALRRAARLQPDSAEVFSLLGQALVASVQDSSVSPAAQEAFEKAVAINPSDPSAQYFLGQAMIARGEVSPGIAQWRRLQAQLAPTDPRRGYLDSRIAEVQGGAAADPGQSAMIEGMVANLAKKLEADPNDPEGWARLVRSYGVLARPKEQQAALAAARRALAGQPEALAKVEAEAQRRPGG